MTRTILAALALAATLASQSQVSIVGYTYISEHRIDRTHSAITYKATLHNSGAAIPRTLVAHATSADPTVVCQLCFLSWPPMGPGATEQSSDTFTVILDRTKVGGIGGMVWTFGE